MSPQDYDVSLKPLRDTDGGGFEGIVPALPGCRSDGDTPQEALTNTYDAIVCWIEEAQDLGRIIPPPTPAAAIPGSFESD